MMMMMMMMMMLMMMLQVAKIRERLEETTHWQQRVSE
jgi:Na+/melibiose symporter-like transporter